MSKIIKIWILVISIGLSYASASTMDIRHNGYGANSIVKLTYAGGNLAGPAGVYMFDKSGSTGEGNDWSDGTRTVFGFCMDLNQSTSYNYSSYYMIAPEDGPNPYGPMGSAKANLLRELWANHFDPSWVGNGPFTLAQKHNAAAFDASIWEIIYEVPCNGMNVSDGSGTFYLRSATTDYTSISGIANGWLGSLTGSGPFADLLSLSSPQYQDMLTLGPPAVPEPATIAFLLTGLFGFVRIRRNKC